MVSSPFKGEVGRGMGEEELTDHPVFWYLGRMVQAG